MARTSHLHLRTEENAGMDDVLGVLFVCVHNADRSQMAAAFLADLAGDTVDVRSAGSTPADKVNPLAAEAIREAGIDDGANSPDDTKSGTRFALP
jgi:arsenate reductase